MLLNISLLAVLTNVGLFIFKLFLLILVLGIIILVHEFGHFIWAKKFGVHIYEFSIGMGPVLFSWKGKKDKIPYSIRLIPIGGYVSLAGEVYDDDEKIPKEDLMCNKKWYQRLVVFVAGVTNNFILAIVLLLVYASIWGGGAIKPVIDKVENGSAAQESGIIAGDVIKEINGYKVGSWDKAQIIMHYKSKTEYKIFNIEHKDGTKENIKITPKTIVDEKTKQKTIKYGIYIKEADTSNPLKVIGYGFEKFGSIVSSMAYTIWGLITGKISVSELSGPVGIYQVVGDTVSYGIKYIIYILAFLSINVGFINILPFPAFDGGHVFFLLVEKIKGSPVNSKFESICHVIGFILIILLMICVSINDIIKLF